MRPCIAVIRRASGDGHAVLGCHGVNEFWLAVDSKGFSEVPNRVAKGISADSNLEPGLQASV
jgi:hypothetical protein